MRDTPADGPEPGEDSPGDATNGFPRRLTRRKRTSAAQTIGGVLFGFEQQVWRTAPPPQELVHHARPDAPIPAKDGTMLTILLPDGVEPADESSCGPDGVCQPAAPHHADDPPQARAEEAKP
jgi:hypothetical protein